MSQNDTLPTVPQALSKYLDAANATSDALFRSGEVDPRRVWDLTEAMVAAALDLGAAQQRSAYTGER